MTKNFFFQRNILSSVLGVKSIRGRASGNHKDATNYYFEKESGSMKIISN